MMHARPRLAFDPRVSCSWRDVWPCVHVRGETAVLHEGLTLLEDIVGDFGHQEKCYGRRSTPYFAGF